jgi:hypothetical protein
MRVEVARNSHGFCYEIVPEPDDTIVGRVEFGDRPNPMVELVELAYRVELPDNAIQPHPDLHAAAIWSVLRPYIGHRLVLPFGVSSSFSNSMRRQIGVEIPVVDRKLAPRRPASKDQAGLLYSGGMDSACASLVLPPDMVHMALARIPRAGIPLTGIPGTSPEQVDLLGICADTAALGRKVVVFRDDHEALTRPYPTWHSNIALLPALYLADTYQMSVVETGDVLNAFAFPGYHADSTSWKFSANQVGMDRRDKHQQVTGLFQTLYGLKTLGLRPGGCVMGLTEVGTARLVARSPLRGRTYSCYRPVPDEASERYCYACDKCFRKVLLSHVVEDREVPSTLFEQFLSQPHLAAIFARPFPDWHDIWFYIFQKIRCDHPFVQRMQAQARLGPDMSWMERWYSPAKDLIPPTYREHVVQRILDQLEPMTAQELVAIEHLKIPPLPVLEPVSTGFVLTTGQTTTPPPSDLPPEITARNGVVIDIEEEGGENRYRFEIGPAQEGMIAYIRGRHLALTHQPCKIDHEFHVVVAALYRVMRKVESIAGETEDKEWNRLIQVVLEQARTSCRYKVSVAPWI